MIRRAVTFLPSRPARGDGVDAERHRQARLVDGEHGQRARVGGVGQRVADRDVGQAGDGDDLAGAGRGRVDPVERLGDVQLGDLDPLDGAVVAAPRDLLAAVDLAVLDPADGEAADVGDASRLVTSAWSGWPGSCSGAGMWVTRSSKSGPRSSPSTSASSVARPALALQ